MHSDTLKEQPAVDAADDTTKATSTSSLHVSDSFAVNTITLANNMENAAQCAFFAASDEVETISAQPAVHNLVLKMATSHLAYQLQLEDNAQLQTTTAAAGVIGANSALVSNVSNCMCPKAVLQAEQVNFLCAQVLEKMRKLRMMLCMDRLPVR